MHLSVQRQSPVPGPISASSFFFLRPPFFFLFFLLSKQHMYAVAFTYLLEPRLPRTLSVGPAAAPTFSGALPERKPPSVSPSVPPGRRARCGPAPRRRRGGSAVGQRPLQLGGEPPRPGASIHGLRQRARGHLAPLRLLPSASPTTRCVYFSPRPLPANPPSAEPQQPGWPPSHH